MKMSNKTINSNKLRRMKILKMPRKKNKQKINTISLIKIKKTNQIYRNLNPKHNESTMG